MHEYYKIARRTGGSTLKEALDKQTPLRGYRYSPFLCRMMRRVYLGLTKDNAPLQGWVTVFHTLIWKYILISYTSQTRSPQRTFRLLQNHGERPAQINCEPWSLRTSN